MLFAILFSQGTHEVGGLTVIQALEIIRGCRGMNIIGGDLVEVCSHPLAPSVLYWRPVLSCFILSRQFVPRLVPSPNFFRFKATKVWGELMSWRRLCGRLGRSAFLQCNAFQSNHLRSD